MTEIYALVIIPFLIFFARVIDVSIGTIRIIFIGKGLKYLAPFVGFFEVLIWLMAIGQIIQNLTIWYYYLFYAAGFATGNFVGIIIEEKLSIGMVGIRIITKRDASELVYALKKEHFGLTVVDAEGIDERVKIIYSVVQRQCLEKIIELVKKYNPTAFYSIEDIRFVNEALHPPILSLSQRAKSSMTRRWRKGK